MKKMIAAVAVALAGLTSGCAFWDQHKPSPGWPGGAILGPILSSVTPAPGP